MTVLEPVVRARRTVEQQVHLLLAEPGPAGVGGGEVRGERLP
ncbi:hypothetical protein [Streptomyces violascens]